MHEPKKQEWNKNAYSDVCCGRKNREQQETQAFSFAAKLKLKTDLLTFFSSIPTNVFTRPAFLH